MGTGAWGIEHMAWGHTGAWGWRRGPGVWGLRHGPWWGMGFGAWTWGDLEPGVRVKVKAKVTYMLCKYMYMFVCAWMF